MSDDTSLQSRLEQQAGKALLQNAFFRWESAVMIGGAIVLSLFVQPFPGWPWWAWPLIGLLGEAALVISSLTDQNERERVVESLFREKYNTSGIRDRDLRAKLDEAEQYRQRIQQVVDQQPKGPMRDHIAATTNAIYDWIANMVRLARRIDAYRGDAIIQRDLKNVPAEITDLNKRIALERDERVRVQMNATLASKQQFAANLDELHGRMERADLQLDHSLAALGTVYSQILLISSQDVDSDKADRLRADIRGEVSALQDLVESLNEVYNYPVQADAGGATPAGNVAEQNAKPRDISARR
jgi:hypothetical protein